MSTKLSLVCFLILAATVRADAPSGRYVVDSTDGTVFDNSTGLLWERGDSGSSMSLGSALSYCEGLSLAGFTDWRLPNIKELQTIVDDTKDLPAIDTNAFPNPPTSPTYVSSTPNASAPAQFFEVEFQFGKTLKSTSPAGYARCVR